MDQSRISRFILFVAISMTIMMLWNRFVIQPRLAKQQQQQQKQKQNQANQAPKALRPLVAKRPLNIRKKREKKKAAVLAKKQPKIARYPRKDVYLGSLDTESGYFMRVKISSRGAAVQTIELNDERYVDLDRTGPLKILNDNYERYRTFQTSVEWIDDQSKENRTSLEEVDWKLEKTEKDDADNNQAVVFSYTVPDHSVKITKRFHLRPITVGELSSRSVRDSETDGYLLDFDLSFEHLGGKPVTLSYVLQGPVGVPLEHQEQTRVFRNVKTGFLGDTIDDDVKSDSLTAAKVSEQDKNDEIDSWKGAIQYLGIDVKYFTALMIPQENQLENPYIESSKAQLLSEATNVKHSDISVVLESKELVLKNRETVTHSYSLFAGPKRKELLTAFHAEASIEFGWFGTIAVGLLWILKVIFSVIGNYGVAIILLTIIVRGSMFPLSRKQAKGAKKMKELQPKIKELKKKFGDDRKKMAEAQMELFSKHGYNPVAGCLPLILQMPIIFSLYRALNNAVDLRLAKFLWINNLASPDALFKLPFVVPVVGWSTFNLLPILTTILFVVQQKMFTPPAIDDQGRMQQKMMMYMSIFFGFLFYSMPSGLCVYFISSSLWGLAERKLVDWQKDEPKEPIETKEPADNAKDKPDKIKKEKPKGFMARLMAAADDAARLKAESDEKKKHQSSRLQNDQRKKKAGSKKNKRSRR